MARRKGKAVEVPQTTEAAHAVLAAFIADDRRMLETRLFYQRQQDRLKQELADVLAPVQLEQAARFAQLKAWWEAGGRQAAGKARSAELLGAKIGFRLGMPRMVLKGLKADDLIAWLRSRRWSKAQLFLRTKTTIDKEAIIKHLRADDDVIKVLTPLGVSVVQEDEFFIDTGLDEEAVAAQMTAA